MPATRYLFPLLVGLLAACSDATAPDLSRGPVPAGSTQTTSIGHKTPIGTGHTSVAQ